MVTVTKKFEFAYAHHLPDYPGKCINLHGHNATLEVEVAGPPIGKTAGYPTMVMDFGELKRVVNEKVIKELDHSLLNTRFTVPTAEAMAKWIWDVLVKEFGVNLVRVRVYETSDSYAEVK